MLLFYPAASAQTVRFQTNLGNIDVALLPESAPATVENFLKYVNRGSYTNSFFHRSVPGFIIQGGGFQFENNLTREIPADPPVRNEYRVSNTRGTIAMAKLGNDPNSATTQWFFNLANNGSNLNTQNGGFTVFGRIVDTAGLGIIDRIAAVPIYNAGGAPFDQLPLQNYRIGSNVTAANLIMVTSITLLEPSPAINANGVISATAFGGFPYAAPGSYIEIYGSNFADTSGGWDTAFVDGRAPTALQGVTVTIDGKPAFVNFVSPNQVNVQVPADVSIGGSVPVVVNFKDRSSAATMLSIRGTAAGLLAPSAFKSDGKQYAAVFHHSTGTLVGNGAVPNSAATPAVPGETLTFYGIGFGPVNPGPVAGQLASGPASIVDSVAFFFGNVQAQVLYAGLVPDLVGIYQFNVVVPAGLGGGDIPLRVQLGANAVPQTLFVPVQN